jgi:predicted RND superfamily exporter protein
MSAIPSKLELAKTGRLTISGVERPRLTIFICVAIALLFGAAFLRIKIDTNPKNMLPPDSEVRLWNAEVEERFGLHEDTIVIGVRPQNGTTLDLENLKKLEAFTNDVLALQGLIHADVTSLYTVDNVTTDGESLRIAPLVARAPTSAGEAESLRRQLFEGTLFVDRLISRDERTTAVYVPLEDDADGARIAEEIRAAALKHFAADEIYLAGDPVARDLFGAEMFKLMGIFAPIAGALMMVLMFWMFRSWWLAGVMMLTAMISIMIAMGAAIALGFPVHIMSSMAPVFLMAIATDSIHIFNEFFQRNRPGFSRAEVVRQTIGAVSRPVRYTALATALGFAVLLLMQIVPVKVFGGIVVLGTIVLRVLSFYLIPACLMLVPLPNTALHSSDGFARVLSRFSSWVVDKASWTVAISLVIALLSVWGASKSVVDNNMVRWFKEGSTVRTADALFSKELGGALPASLVIDTGRLDGIKDPAVLRGIEAIQRDLAADGIVGSSLSVADYVKRIHAVLNDAPEALPDEPEMISQYLLAFSMGARPSDLNRVVDYEYQRANVLLQLRSGDARAMGRVEERVRTFVREKRLPFEVSAAGPAHFNLIWNEQVLKDMILGFIIALAVVFIALAADFRSIKWALVAYVPLLLTVSMIYAALGFIGKPIDMPVAVLSCLSLGMAVDFAIHFVTRYRQHRDASASTAGGPANREQSLRWTIEWPGKGIARNALMFAVAFAVMLAAPLTPYVTVGAFIVSMMTLSAIASITLLPALIKVFRL